MVDIDRLRAKDVMQTRVTRVGANDPLISIHRLFCDEEISGAPVVSDAGDLLGVVSMRDLVSARRDELENRDRGEADMAFFRDEIYFDHPMSRDLGSESFDQLTELTASDVMSPEALSVPPDALVSDVAELILEHRVHRVLVVEPGETGDSLIGIISLIDLVQILA